MQTDPEGRTAVHYAAFFGKHRALKFLIDTASDWTPWCAAIYSYMSSIGHTHVLHIFYAVIIMEGPHYTGPVSVETLAVLLCCSNKLSKC